MILHVGIQSVSSHYSLKPSCNSLYNEDLKRTLLTFDMSKSAQE